jgi:hypothetical protein
MYKIFEYTLIGLAVVVAGIAMVAAWIFSMFLIIILYLIKVGVLAGLAYLGLRLFGVL